MHQSGVLDGFKAKRQARLNLGGAGMRSQPESRTQFAISEHPAVLSNGKAQLKK